MTEEIKNEETKECKCCECREKLVKGLKEFTFKAAIVYVGVTLAIITSANVLKPKHPCNRMMPHRPGIERQLPPPMIHHQEKPQHYRAHKPEFNRPNIKIEKKQFKRNFADKNQNKALPVIPEPQNINR